MFTKIKKGLLCLAVAMLSLGNVAHADTSASSPTVPVVTTHGVKASATDLSSFQLTPKSLYAHAHPVVKGVVIILVLCSIITWAVFLLKAVQLIARSLSLKKERPLMAKAQSLDEMKKALTGTHKTSLCVQLIGQIEQELQYSNDQVDEDLKERVDARLSQATQQVTQHMRYGLGALATIGAVAPFIGLFGTVWGIMNSFIGIAQTRTTDLLAVGPGIAEALFATALGLIAAIPAVILYNAFTKLVNNYSLNLNSLANYLLLAIRRDISLNRLHHDHA